MDTPLCFMIPNHSEGDIPKFRVLRHLYAMEEILLMGYVRRHHYRCSNFLWNRVVCVARHKFTSNVILDCELFFRTDFYILWVYYHPTIIIIPSCVKIIPVSNDVNGHSGRNVEPFSL